MDREYVLNVVVMGNLKALLIPAAAFREAGIINAEDIRVLHDKKGNYIMAISEESYKSIISNTVVHKNSEADHRYLGKE